jgi:hypothetical protein
MAGKASAVAVFVARAQLRNCAPASPLAQHEKSQN